MVDIEIEWHGRIDYQEAWDMQKRLADECKRDSDLPSKLLLLEHPPTYTLGRNGRIENLLLSEEELAQRGIGLFRVERGGDITYHGPGQLVGYPILNLRHVYAAFGLGQVREYVADLEEVLSQTLAKFGLNGRCNPKHRGVWIETPGGLNKIAAIGVRISGGISSHGFALNVAPDMDYFSGIIPCGITEFGTTSMTAELGREVTIEEVLPCLTAAFEAVFSNPTPGSKKSPVVCHLPKMKIG
jgi:lipoate-protein ligase B